jgi:hypothetical protein
MAIQGTHRFKRDLIITPLKRFDRLIEHGRSVKFFQG